MFDTKHITASVLKAGDGEPEGTIRAVFSTFDEVDRDGEIVLASAFTHGQAVAMTWAHRWDMPIGKGAILVEPGRAIFDGQLFMDTDAGQEAYKTIRNMGDLQQYSWGFRVIEAAYEEREDQWIRIIKRAEVFEVSPVLIGANSDTYTLGIKASMPFNDQVSAVLAAVGDLGERTKALAALRAKEGRAISTARREQMATIAGQLREAATGLDAILKETEPAKGADVAALYAAYQKTIARLNGVAV
jgi:HK97 family phage prohead protease